MRIEVTLYLAAQHRLEHGGQQTQPHRNIDQAIVE